jgi:hypothetical protein
MAGCRPLRGLSSIDLYLTPRLRAGLVNAVASRLSPPEASYPQQYENLGGDPCAGVENDVVYCAGARRDEGLVPFVEAGNESSSQDCDVGPAEGPVHMIR